MIPSYDKKINRKVRVFISSTFADMQKERNVIVHSVFPRLRKEFSSRLIDITEVDLRWGIPEDDAENSRILEICIGEVLHCAPFFVGIVGNRYGSIASDEAVENLPPAYRDALGEFVPSGLSITELEMRAGVFIPNNVDYSCFFIKDSVDTQVVDMQPEVTQLISNIKSSYSSYTYCDTKEFENLLFVNLRNYINRVIPEKLEIPYGDDSYFSHLKLLKNNNYRYIPDNLLITGLERKINQYKKVYIMGKKGYGKSACISYLIEREGVERNNTVFFHFSAAGNQSARIENVFFRLRKFLESEFGYKSIEKDNRSAVMEIVRADVIKKRIVLFFDALDQLDDVTAIYQFFILADHNDNVHIVCSGTEEYTRILSDQIVVMSLLTTDQIAQIVNGTLSQYRKRLSRQMKHEISTKANCANPLFLRALLSQLIMYGTYETFDSFFHELLNADSFSELFHAVILRIKNYFKENGIAQEIADLALAFIVYSNNGLTENELQEILNILPVARSVFLSAIELFTIEDNGLIRFNHDLIIKTVKDELEKTNRGFNVIVANQLIQFFSNKENNWRQFSELPYQLYKLGKIEELKHVITDWDCFNYLSKYEYHSCIGYFSHLVDHQSDIVLPAQLFMDSNRALKFAEIMCLAGCHYIALVVLNQLKEKENDQEILIRIMDIMARSQYKLAADHFNASIASYRELLNYYRTSHPDDDVGYASRAYLLGVAYKSSGNLDLSTRILAMCEEVFEEKEVCSATSIWVMNVYGGACFSIGQLNTSLELLDKSITDCKYLFGKNSSELAWAYCYGWNILYSIGDKVNALSMIENAFDIYSHLYMGKGSKVAWASVNAGTAAMISNDLEKAEEYYQFSISENDCILPKEQRPHVYSLTTYANLSILFEKTNRHSKAVSTCQFALAKSEEKNGIDHIYTANILLIFGIIVADVEKIRKAVELYDRQHLKTPDKYFAQVCLARVLVQKRDFFNAKNCIEACAKDYFSATRETDLISFLVLDTVEKISGNLTEELSDDLDELYRFNDYEYYVTHNNNSQIIPIPRI